MNKYEDAMSRVGRKVDRRLELRTTYRNVVIINCAPSCYSLEMTYKHSVFPLLQNRTQTEA